MRLFTKGHRASIRTEFTKGHLPWNTGLTKETDKRVQYVASLKIGNILSEETKAKIRAKKIGKHPSPATEYKKGTAHFLWGKHRPIEVRRKMSASQQGKFVSDETRMKLRKAILELKDLRGNEGSPKHRKAVRMIASQMRNDGHRKVEIEKTVPVNGHKRIIDILVDDTLCLEIGDCHQSKIDELVENGFQVIRFPYSVLGVE